MTEEEFPLVTVVTVTYNSAAYVRDAIDSVLAQRYRNIEYIIGDDCSTDDTWNIIREYHDPRIRAYRNETNLREYFNRNKAIGLSQGRYLIFIDGDDIIYPHAIGFFVEMMRLFPQAAIAIQKGYVNNVLFPALFTPEMFLRNYFYGRNNLSITSFASNFFRNDILKQFPLRTDYISGDDEIRLRIGSRHPVLYVAGSLTWFRETPGQASMAVNNRRALLEYFRFTGEVLTDPEVANLPPGLLDDLKNENRRRLARFALGLLKKADLSGWRAVKKQTGLSLRAIRKTVRHRAGFTDPLQDFTPVRPLRTGFLRDGSSPAKQ